jgi:hypothetical protein
VAGREQFHHDLWTQAHTQSYIAITDQAHATASSTGENPAQFTKAAQAAGFLSAGFYPTAKRRTLNTFRVSP